MPNRCVAFGCNNTSSVAGVSVFKFPKEESLKRKWIKQVKRTRDKWAGPTVCSVVCSNHFTDDCFNDDCELHESFGLRRVRRLKDSAVPTIFKRKASYDDDSITSEPASKKKRSAYEKRERMRVKAPLIHL